MPLADKFNDKDWVPCSLTLPEVHDDFAESKLLGLAVQPVDAEHLQKKLSDAHCKMVKVIADWQKSGGGGGQPVDDDGPHDFMDGDDRKNFLRERPSHVLHSWHLSHTHGILKTVHQQSTDSASVDGP